MGCAGTLHNAVKIGSKVKIICFGEGVSSRFPIGKELSKKAFAKKIRESEAKKAFKILKIKDCKFGSKFCTKFDKYPLSEFISEAEKIISNFKPNIIFTHSNRDLILIMELFIKL